VSRFQILALRDCWLGRGECVYATIRFYLLGVGENRYCTAVVRMAGVPASDTSFPDDGLLLFGESRATEQAAMADADEFEGWLLDDVEWREVDQ